MNVGVKVCGITNLHDAKMCIDAGADALGFVTEYPIPVPWNLKRSKTKELISRLPSHVSPTVVTSGSLESILRITRETLPTYIQLHGEETLCDVEIVVNELSDDGVRVIKALSIDVDSQKACFEPQDPIEAVNLLQKTGIHAIVLDSKTKSKPAGTGRTLNWEFAREIRKHTSLPIILAGGLNQENVKRAISTVKPNAVDVITGVEKHPGKKDPKKVRSFIEAVKGRAEARTLKNHWLEDPIQPVNKSRGI